MSIEDLFRAIEKRDVGACRRILAADKLPLNTRNAFGHTPLNLAVSSECPRPIYQMLIDAGADIHARGDKQHTPLHNAALEGDIDTIRHLLDLGADIEARCSDQKTPLFWAIGQNRLDVVEFLVERGADVHAIAKDNMTTLYYAAFHGAAGVADFLIKEGVALETTHAYGENALYRAAMRGFSGIVESLVDAGANINQSNRLRATPLATAVSAKQAEVVQVLLDRGAKLGYVNPNGCNELHAAVGARSIDIVKMLVDHEPGLLTHVDKMSKTPLHAAIAEGHLAIVDLLISRGVGTSYVPEPIGNHYLTPFQYAVWIGQSKIVRHFIEKYGEDHAQRTMAGRTMMQTAGKHAEVKAVLRSAKTTAVVDMTVAAGAATHPDSARSAPKSRGMSPL